MNTLATSSASETVPPLCLHCGNEVPSKRCQSGFCCAGCETVYAVLKERGLGRFYEIRSLAQSLRQSPKIPENMDRVGRPDETFQYLDESAFLALYAERVGGGRTAMRFYLDGVHCAACVWLTERVGDFVPEVVSVRLNLGESVVKVIVAENGSFSAVAREFARFGYHPHPVRADEADGLNRRSDHWLLARTGVAGACTGNIMLLAVSLYAGADGRLAEVFRWASFALSLPVLAFSAQPFYRGAWIALRTRRISIDLPIALGIALGAISSVYNLATGSPYLYFDSLSALVFLMLASRYFLIKAQRAATHSSKLIRFLTPLAARVAVSGTGDFRMVPVDQVRSGDPIEIFTGESIPVDGVVISGKSAIDYSQLTGESKPVRVDEGDVVFAGTINQESPLRIRATNSGSATRLGRMLSALQEDLTRKPKIVTFADQVARYFVAAVLISVGIVFLIGLRQGLHEAVNLALALSIVTCPCAFALGTPLALSVTLGRCAKKGVLIKGADVLERLDQVREVLFDKTGTLTVGKYGVVRWDDQLHLESDLSLVGVLVALESRSRHLLARAMNEQFGLWIKGPLPEIQDFREVLGEGVSGWVSGRFYKIGASPDQKHPGNPRVGSSVGVWRDGVWLGSIYFQDELRRESPGVFRRLRRQGLRVGILSGDSGAAVWAVSRELKLPAWCWKAGLSPEQKRQEILKRPLSMMVGDGANDAAALAAAYVSVAVHGGVEVSLQSADVYSRTPGVRSIPPLLIVAHETMRVIRRNFVFSLVYNGVGIVGVLYGWVTPLFAAVLMPLSAMTVFLSSLAGTSRLRRALKEMDP